MKFFTQIANTTDKKIGKNDKNHKATYKNQMKISFCQNDAEDIIQNMQTDKACGPNRTPTSMLRTFKKIMFKTTCSGHRLGE